MSEIAVVNVIKAHLSEWRSDTDFTVDEFPSMVLVRPWRIACSSPNSKLRHLPFFEEIASREEGASRVARRDARDSSCCVSSTRGWRTARQSRLTTAGAFAAFGTRSTTMDEARRFASILGRVVDALAGAKARHSRRRHAADGVRAGARVRRASGCSPPTSITRVLAHLHPVEDSDASIAAHLRLGQCYRNLHRIDDATEAFAAASEIATAVGRHGRRASRAHWRRHSIAVLRGNLPQRRSDPRRHDSLARLATGLRDVRSRALHDRSDVAHRRGQYELGDSVRL